MKDFAKLFRDDEIGQVLVTQRDNEEGDPGVEFTVQTSIGKLSVNIGYQDSDMARRAFDQVDKKKALEIVRELVFDSPFAGLIEGSGGGSLVDEED